MKKSLFILIAVAINGTNVANGQGCVAVRTIAGFGQYNQTENAFSTSKWQININNRYFKAFRDFKDFEDQKTAKSNQSIIRSFSADISATHFLNKGWSINVSLPLIANRRSATLEHGGPGTPRYSTNSSGMGDLRLTAYKWLLQPSISQKINLQFGLGIKFPTGNYKAEDYFIRNDSTRVLAPVNPSIQLGDGGTGIITEFNGFYIFNKTVSLYGNLYYLFSPKEHNGVFTTAGGPVTDMQMQTKNFQTSVTDQYSIRAGINLNFTSLSLSTGLRHEGVPVYDIIGGSNGTRRAGYNLSLEPGIIYKIKNIAFYTYLPVIVSRRVKQNVPDKKASELSGIHTVTQGGFANYLVFAGVAFKL